MQSLSYQFFCCIMIIIYIHFFVSVTNLASRSPHVKGADIEDLADEFLDYSFITSQEELPDLNDKTLQNFGYKCQSRKKEL